MPSRFSKAFAKTVRGRTIKVQITDDAHRFSGCEHGRTRYITRTVRLPDKAIDVIDEAGARIRLRTMTRPPDLKEIDVDIERLNNEKEDAVANQDFEKAASQSARSG